MTARPTKNQHRNKLTAAPPSPQNNADPGMAHIRKELRPAAPTIEERREEREGGVASPMLNCQAAPAFSSLYLFFLS